MKIIILRNFKTEELDIENDFMEYYNNWDRWLNNNVSIYEPSVFKEKFERYRIKANIRRIEDFNQAEPYIIKTYSEFKTITDIKNIIITNKKKQEGYIMLDTSKE